MQLPTEKEKGKLSFRLYSLLTQTYVDRAVVPDKMVDYKKLDSVNLVPNTDAFECSICLETYEPGEGVVLRECLHTFCRQVLFNLRTYT